MSYIALSELVAKLPEEIHSKLLDDSGSGTPQKSVWDVVLIDVTKEIDGRLSQKYTLPLAEPVPAIVSSIALVLAVELVYQRRGFYGDANPWTDRAREERKTLDKIAMGTQQIQANVKKASAPAAAITAPAKTTSSTGSMLT